MAQANDLTDQYFGSIKDPAKAVTAIRALERDHWQALEQRQVPLMWREVTAQAYGIKTDGTSDYGLQYADPEGNALKFRINLTRPHLNQQITLAQGKEKISYQARAINNDVGSLAQVGIASKALDYIVHDAQLDQIGYKALESNGYYGRGSIWARWDPEAGEMVDAMGAAKDPKTGEPVLMPGEPDPTTGEPGQPQPVMVKTKARSGAPKLSPLFPWQCLTDTVLDDSPWCIIKEPVSKWELAAQFQEKAKQILSATSIDRQMGDLELFGWTAKASTKDIVILRHFYHRDSKAVSGGRWIGYVGDTWLWDLPCPVAQGLPVVHISTAQYIGTQIGYPQCIDLLSLQEALIEVASQTIDNTMRFGNQSLYVPQGTEYDREAIARGGAFLEIPEGKTVPKAIEYSSMGPGAKYIMDLVPQMMTEISGLNSVTRGQPDANITSGTFAALMVNIAENQQGPTQLLYDQAVVRLGNMILELLRNNAKNGFMAEVSGAGSAPYMKHFQAEELRGVHKVQISRQNPIVSTFPARMEILNAIKDLPKDDRMWATGLLLTGSTDSIVEDGQSQFILIQAENERLMAGDLGDPVTDPMTGQSLPPNGLPALVTDDPKLHCLGHRRSLDKLRAQPKPQPGSQEEKQLAAAIVAHIMHMSKHGAVWREADPVMTQIVGIPMPAPTGMPAQVPGQEPAPATSQPPQQGKAPGANSSLGKVPKAPKPPRMPKPAEPPANLNQSM